MNCEIYVAKRFYSKPGPCASKNTVQAVTVRDVKIRACAGHRAVLQRGQPFERVRGRR